MRVHDDKNKQPVGSHSDTIIVIYSGGIDSTLTLLDAVECKEKNPNVKIYTIYTNQDFLPTDKSSNELRARESIINYFNEKYKADIKDIILDYSKVSIQENIQALPQELAPVHLPQPAVWMNSFAEILTFLKDGAEINYSILSTDDSSQYIAEILNIFDSTANLVGKNNVLLNMPYANYSKHSIIDNYIIRKQGHLLEKCWVCENPNDSTPCGVCGSCLTIKSALLGMVVDLQDYRELLPSLLSRSKYKLVPICKDTNCDSKEVVCIEE